jgi:hypothetical protein
MGKKRRKRKSAELATNASPRDFAQAMGEAVPDLLALGACLLAWTRADAVRFDLIALAAPMAFVQMALSVPQLFSGVLRLSDAQMSRQQKAGFIVWPVVCLVPIVWVLLGHWALLSMLLFSAQMLYRALSGRIDTSAPVRGAYVTYAEGEDGIGADSSMMTMSANSSARRRGKFKQWRVEVGHAQVMATLTLAGAFVTVLMLAFTDLGSAHLDAAQLAASTWPKTPIGQLVAAHYALAAGIAIFGMRAFAQFEGVGANTTTQAPIDIKNDPVLREIIEKVERESSKR